MPNFEDRGNSGGGGGTVSGDLISQLPVAASPQAGDLLPVSQDGSTLVQQTMAQITTYIAGLAQAIKYPTLQIAITTNLDATQHQNKLLVCTAALTITATTFANVGDGFRCLVLNLSGAAVTFGTGITTNSGGTTLSNNQMASIVGTSDNNTVFASIEGASTGAATGITITQVGTTPGTIANQVNGVAFTVAGALTGYAAPPALYYLDNSNSGAWLPLPTGATTSTTAYSFTHPSMAAGTGSHVWVKDATGLSVAVQSAPFNVTVPSTPTVTINPLSPVAVLAGNSTTTANITASLAAYPSAPPTSQFTVSTTGAGGSFSALPGGATVTLVSGQNYTLAFTLTGLTGGTDSIVVKDTINGNSPAVALVIAQFTSPVNVPSSGTQFVPITNFTGTVLGITNAFACLHNATSGDETPRTSFTSGGSLSLTPQAAGTNETVRVFDALSGGNMLYESATFTVAAAPSITLTQPTAKFWSTAFAIAGTYTSTAPTNVDVQVDGAGAYTTCSGFSASAGTWSATVPGTLITSGTPHTLRVRETNATTVISSISGNIAFSAAPAFQVTSVAPTQIGTVGNNQTFQFGFTGSVGAVTVSVDGGAGFAASNVTDLGGGAGTFTITGPALLASSPWALHNITAAGTTGGACPPCNFATNKNSSPNFDVFINGGNYQGGGASGRFGSYTMDWGYPGTSASIGGTPSASMYLTGNGNNPPGDYVVVTLASLGTSATSWSLSNVIPPTLPIKTGTFSIDTTCNFYQDATHMNGSILALAGGCYIPVGGGGFYGWFVSSEGYAVVSKVALLTLAP